MTLDEFRKEFDHFFSFVPLTETDLDSFFFSKSFDLPEFPSDRALSLSDSDTNFLPPDELQTVLVPIDRIVGDGWLFWDGPGKFGYPKESKLVHWYFNEYTPIPATYIEDQELYHVIDGNHRIYAAYLRGVTEIPILVEATTKNA